LTYDDADQMIRESDASDLSTGLCRLNDIALALRDERERNGALRLVRPELKVKVKGGDVSLAVLDTNSASRNLVSEMMILANRLSAEFGLRHDIPIIYRTQPAPASKIPVMESYDPVQFINSVRQLKKSRMTTQPEKHAGLGLDVYTQASSPLRRYADLAMQRQFVAHLNGEPYPYEIEELIEVLGEAERIESQNKRLEREVSQYWTLEYVKRNFQDQEFEAIVLPAGRNGQEVMLKDWAIQGSLSKGTKAKAGACITVTVGNVKPRQGLLVFVAV
jgi:exoribonuclease-2